MSKTILNSTLQLLNTVKVFLSLHFYSVHTTKLWDEIIQTKLLTVYTEMLDVLRGGLYQQNQII